MNTQVLKQENDVTVFADGNVTISQRKLAKLLDINENTLFTYLKRKHKNYNTSNGLDAFLVKCASTYYAYKGNKKAQQLVDKFIEAGAKAFLYHEAGYVFEAKPAVKHEPHADTPTAVFGLIGGKRVRSLYQDWRNMGFTATRKVLVDEEYITDAGQHMFYMHKGKIRIKPDMHSATRLITHGARLAVYGQSDLFGMAGV